MIKAKKSLGQNFLVDEKILKKITGIVDIKDKTVLEVGPGTGNLTSFILRKNPKKFSNDLFKKSRRNFSKMNSS